MTAGPAPVLIVGAGPTGLTLAAQIQAYGGRVRIVERRLDYRRSRAFVAHPRTLELLAPLGVVPELIARGDPSARASVRAGGRSASVTLARPGIRDTAFPFLLAVAQVAVEQVLEAHLQRVGVPVERGVELVGLVQRPESVEFSLRHPDGHREHGEVRYLAGCDGADSTVRREAGIGFPGSDYRTTLLMANLDAEGDLAPSAVNGYVGAGGILFLFPSPDVAPWRLLVAGRAESGSDEPDLPTLQAAADRFTGGTLTLRDLAWSSTVRLRRGQAVRYRQGRVLLAGDAAHLNSPAGAQGMNTGIQDACNLGWKLAMVTAGVAADGLLSTYQPERWPVARRVRQLTDLAFLLESGSALPLRWLREYGAPLALPLVDGRTAPGWAFRLLGGLMIRYRGSPAVVEAPAAPRRARRALRAGDRMPDAVVVADGRECWLFELLRTPGFHALLCGPTGGFGDRTGELERLDVPLSVHRLARVAGPGVVADLSGELIRRLGHGPAVYLIRPDGYIGFRSGGPGLDGAVRYLRDLLGRGHQRITPAGR